VSRGIGVLQRKILEVVAEWGYIQVADLAYEIGGEIRQTRRAVRALEERGLVAVRKLPAHLAPRADGIGRQGRALVVFTPEADAEWRERHAAWREKLLRGEPHQDAEDAEYEAQLREALTTLQALDPETGERVALDVLASWPRLSNPQ
jgi:DNA-binding MarR family transcriptional regulator